ncbi:mCG147219 [Mus musculus]|nr:mCG147219 [Mus musculus]
METAPNLSEQGLLTSACSIERPTQNRKPAGDVAQLTDCWTSRDPEFIYKYHTKQIGGTQTRWTQWEQEFSQHRP